MLSPINVLVQFLSLAVTLFALPSHPHHVRNASQKGNKIAIVERSGTNYTVFEHAATGATLDFVTNSGICETTPGVNQYSGYISLDPDQHAWFWL